MINNFIIYFRFLIQSWGSWRNTYINICFFISFIESSIVVPDKIYKVLTKFFITITIDVKFPFIQMGFWVDVIMTQKKYSFLVTYFGKFHALILHLSLQVTVPDILLSWLIEWLINYWLSVFSNMIIDFANFAILSGVNLELSSFVPTWRIT